MKNIIEKEKTSNIFWHLSNLKDDNRVFIIALLLAVALIIYIFLKMT